MTKDEMAKNISDMEKVIDSLLEEILPIIDYSKYQLLRYYFSLSEYDKILEVLGE